MTHRLNGPFGIEPSLHKAVSIASLIDYINAKDALLLTCYQFS